MMPYTVLGVSFLILWKLQVQLIMCMCIQMTAVLKLFYLFLFFIFLLLKSRTYKTVQNTQYPHNTLTDNNKINQ